MSGKTAEFVESEWSHWINVGEIEDTAQVFDIKPDEEQRKALARRLEVEEVKAIGAHITLQRRGQVIFVQGTVSADVVQNCVVTLEPIETHIEEEFEAWFADPAQAVPLSKARRERDLKKGGSEVPMLEESEDPEAIIDGKIDLGELAVQYLSLGINPYPHAEGVEYENPAEAEREASDHRKNPFAALKDWKDKLK
ncbi:MAG: DUF177 domain-containing protein [Alphaproteobacteria bacterium]|nr:DUF177 domain-containing protein [Alphaproteobacteria bacterium]